MGAYVCMTVILLNLVLRLFFQISGSKPEGLSLQPSSAGIQLLSHEGHLYCARVDNRVSSCEMCLSRSIPFNVTKS